MFCILNSGYNADKLPLGKLSKSTILKVSLYLTYAWKFPFVYIGVRHKFIIEYISYYVLEK
jgi:hypothetical protein